MIKLLLADDSVTIQRVVELTFSGEDVQVISVSDGEQAISRLSSERPDIVLADIGMPKRDGYEVAAFVKGNPDLAHIPVVLLAGAFEPVDEARAKEVQCDGVLVKPFEPQQVIARVRELVNGVKPEPVAPPVAVVTASKPEPPKREPVPEPVAEPVPEPVPQFDMQLQAQDAGEGDLDDYFDRLDAAFATLGTSSAPETQPADDPFAPRELPTIDGLLSEPDAPAPRSSAPMDFGRTTEPAPVAGQRPGPSTALGAGPSTALGAGPSTSLGAGNPIADVFRALFAAEQGDPDAVRRFQAPGPSVQQPIVTDDMVEEVTRRVLERLAPDAARQLVADIVSEIAERLVREEIQRIRNQQ